MSGLPQELIDRIIDHVDDRISLRACSLVSSRWSPRSRKHLFAQVELASISDLQRWCTRIRPGPSGLSSLVEHLTLSECHDIDHPSSMSPSPSWLHPSILTNAAPHFQSFSALRALEIRRWRMATDRILLVIHSLGSSIKNVTRLTLGNVTVHPSTLTMFIGYFPHLDDLSISAVKLPMTLEGTGDSHREFHGEIVPTHPRGEFSASDIPVYQVPEVFKAITLLEPRFHRVTLDFDSYGSWRKYWPLIEACAGWLEELQILTDATNADCNGLSLACCPRLRKIGLSLAHSKSVRPCQFVEKCLSTITSSQLSKVSLRMRADFPIFRHPESTYGQWDHMDPILYNLAGKYKPQYEGDNMVVELMDVNPGPSEAESFLWRYKERGTLRVHLQCDLIL